MDDKATTKDIDRLSECFAALGIKFTRQSMCPAEQWNLDAGADPRFALCAQVIKLGMQGGIGPSDGFFYFDEQGEFLFYGLFDSRQRPGPYRDRHLYRRARGT